MTSRAAVCSAVKARLDAAQIPGLIVEPRWPKAITPPSAGCLCIVDASEIEYGLTFGPDRSRITVTLRLLVPLQGGIDVADEILDRYISNTGGSSLLQALRADPYLSNTVAYALPPTGASNIGVRHFGPDDPGQGFDLFGAEIPFLVDVT